MNWAKVLALLGEILADFELDQALLESGQVVTTPTLVVGTAGGKAIYARVQLCTNNQFPGG